MGVEKGDWTPESVAATTTEVLVKIVKPEPPAAAEAPWAEESSLRNLKFHLATQVTQNTRFLVSK